MGISLIRLRNGNLRACVEDVDIMIRARFFRCGAEENRAELSCACTMRNLLQQISHGTFSNRSSISCTIDFIFNAGDSKAMLTGIF